MSAYKRVLLKLSGEVFGGGRVGVDPDVVNAIAREIAAVVRSGVQVAIVVGGGNFFRGAELSQRGMDRARADYMGMLGTVMNCLALQDFLEKEGILTDVPLLEPSLATVKQLRRVHAGPLIERVRDEARPDARDADELHDAAVVHAVRREQPVAHQREHRTMIGTYQGRQITATSTGELPPPPRRTAPGATRGRRRNRHARIRQASRASCAQAFVPGR